MANSSNLRRFGHAMLNQKAKTALRRLYILNYSYDNTFILEMGLAYKNDIKRVKQEFYSRLIELVEYYFDAIQTENDRFLPTFKDEILLVDLLRKKANYTIEDFNEALNNFKRNAECSDYSPTLYSPRAFSSSRIS